MLCEKPPIGGLDRHAPFWRMQKMRILFGFVVFVKHGLCFSK